MPDRSFFFSIGKLAKFLTIREPHEVALREKDPLVLNCGEISGKIQRLAGVQRRISKYFC
jgi:hypothetical protein